MFRRILNEVLAEQGHQLVHVPASWQNPDCLEYGVYFIIPGALWDAVVLKVGRKNFTEHDVARETELSQAAGERTNNIAIRKGDFVNYADLGPVAPVVLDAFAAEVLRKNSAQAEHLARRATERLAAIDGPRRGYLGWLLTNPTFLDEHDALLLQHGPEIHRLGFPQPVLTSGRLTEMVTSVPVDWVEAFRQFYVRWRLQSLVLPELPLPLPFMIPDVTAPAGKTLQEGVVSSSIPDIYPTRGRGLIDEVIEESLRGRGAPEHLDGWFQIVRKSNTVKNVIPMYDRWFRLQHYWRVLHRRYPESLHRKKRPLIEAFAIFLNISVDTIKADLRRITNRLGSGWERRIIAGP